VANKNPASRVIEKTEVGNHFEEARDVSIEP